MQDIYFDIAHHATANLLELQDGTWLLTGLEVARPYRGQGHGGRLLAQVLQDADREGVTVVLSVDPDGSLDSLDAEQLAAFYARRGFAVVGEGAMRREPQLAVAAPADYEVSL